MVEHDLSFWLIFWFQLIMFQHQVCCSLSFVDWTAHSHEARCGRIAPYFFASIGVTSFQMRKRWVQSKPSWRRMPLLNLLNRKSHQKRKWRAKNFAIIFFARHLNSTLSSRPSPCRCFCWLPDCKVKKKHFCQGICCVTGFKKGNLLREGYLMAHRSSKNLRDNTCSPNCKR